MPRFKKKPITVTAERMTDEFIIETLIGKIQGNSGDWLITGIKGERYPCDDETFRSLYDATDEESKKALEN